MLFALLGIFSLTYSAILEIISKYGYYALFVLLILEAASLPVPSEVILPVAGYLVYEGVLNFGIAFAVILLGGFVGMAINYYIAYFIGKDIVYKHLRLFHIKQESLDAFDAWFKRNGAFTVFIARLMPWVRGLVNFPAGFALMPKKTFYLYSMLGTAIWDIILISFGYYVSKYALSMSNVYYTFTIFGLAIGALAIVLFLVYRYASRRIRGNS